MMREKKMGQTKHIKKIEKLERIKYDKIRKRMASVERGFFTLSHIKEVLLLETFAYKHTHTQT